MARLELQQLCKGYDRPILDRLSLTVEEGEFFVIVGPSGIGKTTLLRCIAGLEVVDAGRVIFGGRDVTRVPPYRRNAAMTFESYALYPHMTVFENIASPLRARRMDEATVRKAVLDVARLLRIEQLLDRRPHEISGGQKQRTALGRTLVAKPDVYLLDEPISHLDAKIRHELRRQFHTLQELRRVATVYVTHDYAEALSLGDRIGVMGDGGLVQVGSSREVFEHPNTIFVARHLGQPSINEVPCRLSSSEEGASALVLRSREGSFSFPVNGSQRAMLEKVRSDVLVGIRPQHIRVANGGAAGTVNDARVEAFEALGATGVLIAKTGGVTLTVLTSPEADFEPGQSVKLALDVEQFLYFDAVHGRNLKA
jgi:multiple sugar transport system ATP-binding protein